MSPLFEARPHARSARRNLSQAQEQVEAILSAESTSSARAAVEELEVIYERLGRNLTDLRAALPNDQSEAC